MQSALFDRFPDSVILDQRLLWLEMRNLERAMGGIAADAAELFRTVPAQAPALLNAAIAGVLIGVSGLRAQDLGNRVAPGLGHLIAVIVALGGLVFNVGNVAGAVDR